MNLLEFNQINTLKTLGLYLYTLIIGHTFCNMLSMLNKLTLNREWQTLVTDNAFLNKKVKTQPQQNKKIKHKNPCRVRELNPEPLSPKADTVPLSQLRVSIVVKPFNCFDVMGRNVNKQSQICGPDIFNKYIFFCNIFTRMNNYIWQFLIFT